MSTGAARWAAAPDLPALAELVIAWLDGEIGETPLHEGGPCEDKLALAPVLKLVNRAGLVTDNAEAGGSDDAGRWNAWVEGIASEATVTRLREAVAGTPLELTALSWTDPAWDHVSEDWQAWADFCPAAAAGIRAARFVIIEDLQMGRDGVLQAALERFAQSVQVPL